MPWPCDGVWWKIHPLLSPGLGKALVGSLCAQSSLAQGLWPCSHVGTEEEEEEVPTLTHRMDTLKNRELPVWEGGS